MKNNKSILIILVALSFGASLLPAQVITPAESRSNLLGGVRNTLSNVDNSAADFSETRSPFVVRDETVQVKRPDTARENTGPVMILPDAVALKLISQQFQPLGSLIMGNRGVLQMGNGRTMAEGETFNAEIKGTTYEVEIKEITQRGYSLTLGTASVKRTFLTTTGATQ